MNRYWLLTNVFLYYKDHYDCFPHFLFIWVIASTTVWMFVNVKRPLRIWNKPSHLPFYILLDLTFQYFDIYIYVHKKNMSIILLVILSKTDLIWRLCQPYIKNLESFPSSIFSKNLHKNCVLKNSPVKPYGSRVFLI